MSELAKRVIVAIVAIPLVALVVWAGGVYLALFLAVLGALGAWELLRLAERAGVRGLYGPAMVTAALLPIGTHAIASGWMLRPAAIGATLLVAIVALTVFERSPEQRPLEASAVTVFGALYCSGSLALAYLLREHQWAVGKAAGSALLFFPIALTWISDSAAYFVGRAVGRRKLFPAVSPKKTVAGAVGAVFAAAVAAPLYVEYVLRPLAQLALSPAVALLFGVVTSVAGQLGDLAESLYKRQAGVKDSSGLIPGHGGILDRLDSLYFVLPVAYLLLGRFLLPSPR
jgi:phosphatidate cytidylyltransferase